MHTSAKLLRLLTIIAACTQFVTVQAADKPLPNEEAFTFITWSKEKAEGYRGTFTVPENRQREDSRDITLHYVRFPATANPDGPPIVYLAGGPGGSGISAVNYRYGMFMALRQFGDVIALDQRGTGKSNDLPECQSKETVPPLKPVSDSDYIAYHRRALRECLSFWRAQGVDLAGYNTEENARDLQALRRHLGAEKIVLWGTSYGSHLALAALKQMPNNIDRIVLSSVEGLDQTIKLPARTDAYFQRLQAAVDQQPAAKAAYPDIDALVRRVHRKLEQNPVRIQIPQRDGHMAETLLRRRDMQLVASGLITDPRSAAGLLKIYRDLDRGESPTLDAVPRRYYPDEFLHPGSPITLYPMPTAVDIASGISDERRARVAREAGTALLKNFLNFSYFYDGMAPELELGDDFRSRPHGSVPLLLLSGTLDGRTYLESQREAVADLENVTTITVENGGHNLFMASTEIQDVIDQFMQGRPIRKKVIRIELPNMAPAG